MAYKVDLPPDLAGHSIDTAHPLFKAFEADAVARGLGQEAFSAALAAYARAATAKPAPAPAAAPAPATAPAPKPAKPFSQMSTREQFTHAVATPSYRGRR
jgi:hypothetical protein